MWGFLPNMQLKLPACQLHKLTIKAHTNDIQEILHPTKRYGMNGRVEFLDSTLRITIASRESRMQQLSRHARKFRSSTRPLVCMYAARPQPAALHGTLAI